jgi:hypothetical protein
MAMLARSPEETIAGEAVSGTMAERFQDMLGIASVMRNRADMLGVSLKDVISAPGQFDAYGQKMPPGTRSLVGLAKAALDQVNRLGPINNATFYATPANVKNLPDHLSFETSTTGHRYFSDPQMRGIITAQGTIVPDPSKLGIQATAVTPSAVPASAIDPAFTASGLLAGNPVSSLPSTYSPGPTPNSFSDLAAAGPAGGQYTDPGDRFGERPPTNNTFADMAAAGPAGGTFQTPDARLGPGPGKFNTFADMAAAGPMAAPVDVNASLAAMTSPNLAASAGVPFSASLFQPAAVAQAPVSSFVDMAAAKPMAAPVDASVSAQLGLTPGLSAETAAATDASGVNSPEMQAMKESVAAQLSQMSPMGATASNNSFSSLAKAGPMATPVDASVSAALGLTPGLAASTNAYQATPTDTASANAITTAAAPSTVSSQLGVPAASNFATSLGLPATDQAPGYQQMANTGIAGGITNLGGTTVVSPNGTVSQQMSDMASNIGNEMSFNQALNPSVPSLSMPSALSIPGAVQPSVATPSINIATDPNLSLGIPSVVQPLDAPKTIVAAPSIAAPIDYTAPASSSVSSAASPMHTAMDVWGGLATTGIATDGSTVSRMDDGTVGRYNPAFDHTEYTNADGSYGGMKPGNTLSGAQSSPTSTTPSGLSGTPMSAANSVGRLSNSVFSGGTLGSMLGAALGSALAGPIGGLALGMVGQKLGGNYLGDQIPDESPMHALMGLLSGTTSKFPSAPTSSTTVSHDTGGYGGLNDYGKDVYGGSGQFDHAIDSGSSGLF